MHLLVACLLGIPTAAVAASIQHPLLHTSGLLQNQAIPAAPQALGGRKLQGRFLHITDIHPDPYYKLYSSSEAEIACHRHSGPAGFYGAETSDCDSPHSLVNATFDWIEKNLKDKIDFVVWTGDSARHDNDEHLPRNASQVIGGNRMLVRKFLETFGMKDGGRHPATPIIPSFGNNDILPHNIFLKGPNKWTRTYADIWRPFIPEEQRHGFDRGGWFYVEVIPNKLAVFSLNTMYFFDSNNAVDGCASQKQPGYEHMEWLRTQLQFLRVRGMKAIISGHVPPARNDEKIGWDETCWQKYALWMRQYRDVVVGSLYGHMNIEHFILQDFHDIDVAVAAGLQEPDNQYQTSADDDVEIEVKTPDYLMALREIWSKLPSVPDSLELRARDNSDLSASKKKHHKDKRTDEQKFLDKVGGVYAERFAVSHISASVVPNFFSTMRVFEYNITGLEDQRLTTEAQHLPVPAWEERVDDQEAEDSDTYLDDQIHDRISSFRNALMGADHRSLSSRLSESWRILRSIKDLKHKKHKKKKPKKPKFTVPEPPSKTAPPGPAYSLQTFSWLGYKQYFANNTYLNNDFTHAKDDASSVDGDAKASGWNPGRYVDKKPGEDKNRRQHTPRNFTFDIEYDTLDEKDDYRLGEGLIVRKWVELAARIGDFKGEKSSKVENYEDAAASLAAQEDGEDGGPSITKHKKHDKKKDKKQRKKRRKIINRSWFAFVSRAVTATLGDEELHDQFGQVEDDSVSAPTADRWEEL